MPCPLTLAALAGQDTPVKVRGCVARHAQGFPSFMLEMLSQEHNLPNVVGVVSDLPVDGLHHGVRLSANEDGPTHVGIGKRSESAKYAVPSMVVEK